MYLTRNVLLFDSYKVCYSKICMCNIYQLILRKSVLKQYMNILPWIYIIYRKFIQFNMNCNSDRHIILGRLWNCVSEIYQLKCTFCIHNVTSCWFVSYRATLLMVFWASTLTRYFSFWSPICFIWSLQWLNFSETMRKHNQILKLYICKCN